MEKLTVITRSFQAGTGGLGKAFDAKFFADKVAEPIRNLMRFSEVVKSVVVVTNGDQSSPWAEKFIAEGLTPTVACLQKSFPGEIAEKKLAVLVSKDWGRNPGSGSALNEGIRFAAAEEPCRQVLIWSPEIAMDGYRIARALSFMERRKLAVVGFLRQGWWERPQWNVPQNTAAIWNREALVNIGGFDPICNGTGKTVWTAEFGEVPLAGLEDFHALLRLMRSASELRWGMIGRENPLRWDTNFQPGSEREKNHLIKVARQFLVMREYAATTFPEVDFNTAMNRLFSLYHQE